MHNDFDHGAYDVGTDPASVHRSCRHSHRKAMPAAKTTTQAPTSDHDSIASRMEPLAVPTLKPAQTPATVPSTMYMIGITTVLSSSRYATIQITALNSGILRMLSRSASFEVRRHLCVRKLAP